MPERYHCISRSLSLFLARPLAMSKNSPGILLTKCRSETMRGSVNGRLFHFELKLIGKLILGLVVRASDVGLSLSRRPAQNAAISCRSSGISAQRFSMTRLLRRYQWIPPRPRSHRCPSVIQSLLVLVATQYRVIWLSSCKPIFFPAMFKIMDPRQA